MFDGSLYNKKQIETTIQIVVILKVLREIQSI